MKKPVLVSTQRYEIAALFAALTSLPVLSNCTAAPRSKAAPRPRAATNTKPLPISTLIVGGGSSPDEIQYAIESNARYVDTLTTRAIRKKVLFADGSRRTRSVNAVAPVKDEALQNALAFLLDDDWPEQTLSYHPPQLRQLDAPASKSAIAHALTQLNQQTASGQSLFLYFTGHGFPGEAPPRRRSGWGRVLPSAPGEDYENTRYALWNSDNLSVRELAAMLRPVPSTRPLVLVMVQCHSGGFANLLFQNGDPAKPVQNRDFCGFFAAIKERMSAGCTPEVDEKEYQDFTTHFFAALSGRSRDGRVVSGADYDGNRRVSMLEAFAWANVYDLSIDVPVSTSDVYLRHIFRADDDWLKISYAQTLAQAAPWQKAMLQGLSNRLKLSGDARVPTAWRQLEQLQRQIAEHEQGSAPWPETALNRRAQLLEQLEQRFPGLKQEAGTASYRAARRQAIAWLRAHRGEWQWIAGAVRDYTMAQEAIEVRAALLLRFVRAVRTIWCEQQLKSGGTATQKQVFARLRASESRNPLRP